jgi:homoserine O-acetyltransferase
VAEDHEVFALGDVQLQSGAPLRDARLAYKTYGELNRDRSNAIVFPTAYGGRHWDNEWLIGEGMGLDPRKYFIIVPNMLGNGLSSSPSNTTSPFNGPRFPNITFHDQVACQHALVTQHLGIETLELVLGWSMGAAQTYQWGVSHPDMMKALLPFCGSSVTSPHNKVFIGGVRAALTADGTWNGGWYTTQPERGLRAAGRAYAGWGFSQSFYSHEEWRKLGYSSLEDFMVGFWEYFFLDDRDANDMLAMFWTWEHGDVGNTPGFGGKPKPRSGRSRPARSPCPRAPTCTSRPTTRSEPVSSSHRPRSGPSPRRGDISPGAASTRKMPSSSTQR